MQKLDIHPWLWYGIAPSRQSSAVQLFFGCFKIIGCSRPLCRASPEKVAQPGGGGGGGGGGEGGGNSDTFFPSYKKK